MTTRTTTSRAAFRAPARTLLAAAMLAAALAPAVARAAIYYVAPTGSDTNPGTTASQPFRTLGKANTTVRPGDIVMVADGTYSQAPVPGVSGTATQRITYVGNLASPRSVVVSAYLSQSRSFVTVKGFHLAAGFTVLNAQRDSIAFCAVGGDRSDLSGSNDCVIAHNEFVCQRFWFFGNERDTITYSYRDTVNDNRFILAPTGTSGHTMRFKNLYDCVFERNRTISDIRPGAIGAGTKWFHVRRSRFVDNSWDVTQNCVTNPDQAGWFTLRDYTQSNLFLRDTILIKGPGLSQIFTANSGTYPGTVMNNNFEYCVFKIDAPTQYNAVVAFQDVVKWDTLSHCTIVGRAPAIVHSGAMSGSVVMDHCTLASIDPDPAVFNMSWQASFTGRTTLTNSILYGWPGRSNPHRPQYAVGDQNYMRTYMRSDRNVFYGSAPADSCILINGWIWSGPGTARRWYQDTGQDGNSIFGDPLFRDASSVQAFDSRLRAGSPARGRGTGGSDIGAWNEATGDATAPAAVGDLRVLDATESTARLDWSAPGDDGNSGTAWGYELRWSDQPITEANFAAARVALVPPRPAAAGTRQGMEVFGLRSGSPIYFALKTRDELGFWSPISNVPSITTSGSDTTPPAAVQDLQTTR